MSAERDRQVSAGTVGRPHGLDGSFHVTVAKRRLLSVGGVVAVEGRELTIERLAGTDAAPLLRLAGVSDRDGAAALKGQQLLVAAEDLPQLEQGEWWAHDLEGCEVLDGALLLGTVSRLLELPSCEALEVERAGGGQLLVPMVAEAIRSVDVQRRRIDVDREFLGELG